MEQEARVALKKDYRSQMQNYRTSILTLFIGFFAGMEALRILTLPYWLVIVMFCAASGLLGGGILYCLARVAWYGRLGSVIFTAAPTLPSRQEHSMENTNTLLNRLGQGGVNLLKSRLTESFWDRLVMLGDPTKTSILVRVTSMAACATFIVILWPFVPVIHPISLDSAFILVASILIVVAVALFRLIGRRVAARRLFSLSWSSWTLVSVFLFVLYFFARIRNILVALDPWSDIIGDLGSVFFASGMLSFVVAVFNRSTDILWKGYTE